MSCLRGIGCNKLVHIIVMASRSRAISCLIEKCEKNIFLDRKMPGKCSL